MNELREQVQGLIDKHDVDSYRASVGAEHSSYPSAAVTTDRILALIAEAMLSDEAVEAAALDNWEHGGYASAYEDIATAMRRSVREIIGYGLAAAGITGADTTD